MAVEGQSGQVENSAGMRSDLLVIQYLRGIAAVGVLGFHACQRSGLDFGMGAAGVDIFFVISGFIMWVVSAGKARGPGDFLLRRAGRIAPLYWTVTLGVVGLDLLRPSLFPNMLLTAPHVVLSLLFLPHQDPHGAVAPVIVPGWTLSYEVFFYLVFALTLFLPLARRAWALTAIMAALCLAGAATQGGGPVWTTFTNPLVLEFVAGVWLAKAWTSGRLGGPAAGWTAVAAGCGLLLAAAVSGAEVSGAARLYLWGLPAVLIVWGGLCLERAGRVARLPPLKLLGDASYSIYLVHGLALSLVFKLLGTRPGLPPALLLACAVPFAALLGTGCYFGLERPLLAVFHPGRRKAAAQASPAKQTLSLRKPSEAFRV
jgi:exopolysaccharide production protein ExoZ